jgi:hypothetical protein
MYLRKRTKKTACLLFLSIWYMVSAKETFRWKGKSHLFIVVTRQEGLRTIKLGIPHRLATLSISPRKNNVDLGRNGQKLIYSKLSYYILPAQEILLEKVFLFCHHYSLLWHWHKIHERSWDKRPSLDWTLEKGVSCARVLLTYELQTRSWLVIRIFKLQSSTQCFNTSHCVIMVSTRTNGHLLTGC